MVLVLEALKCYLDLLNWGRREDWKPNFKKSFNGGKLWGGQGLWPSGYPISLSLLAVPVLVCLLFDLSCAGGKT